MDKPYYMTATALGEEEPLDAGPGDGDCEEGTEEGPGGYYMEPPPQYSGFLFLRCGHCGTERAFYAKIPIGSYWCNVCGRSTPLDELIPATVICKCGKRIRYRTNVAALQLEIPCLQCGGPVALEYIGRTASYVTMNHYRKWKSRKRRRAK